MPNGHRARGYAASRPAPPRRPMAVRSIGGHRIRMHRLFVFALLVVAACGNQAAARPVRAMPSNLPQTISLEEYRAGLKTVTVRLGGRDLKFLFDTGAGVTVVTPETAQSIDCEPSGRIVAHRMSGERIELARCPNATLMLGAVQLRSELGVLDITPLLPADWPRLAGVLSLASFESTPLTLDLARNVLILESEETLRRRTSRMKAVDARLARQGGGASLDVFLAVEGQPLPLWMELDTGNVAGVVVATHARGLLTDEKTVRVVVGETTLHLPGYVADIIYDGNLGARFAEQFVLTFDLSARGVWVERSVEDDRQ